VNSTSGSGSSDARQV